jgi:hypothetical protein
VQNTATLTEPPTSIHFAESQKIKATGTTPTDVNGLAAAPPAPHQYVPYPNPYFGNPYGFNPYMPPLPHNYHQMFQTGCPHTPVAPQENLASAPSSPLKIVLPHVISLDQFCEAYKINDKDKASLLKLKFQPGDQQVECLKREDWHRHSGFSKLAWDNFLQKHKQFVCEVKAGKCVP